MAAGARLHFLGLDGNDRVIPAMGLNGAKQPGLLTAITLPSTGTRLVLDRSLRPVVSLALGLDFDDDDRLIAGRVAIGCAYAAPLAVALPQSEPLPVPDVAERAAVLAHDIASMLPEPVADSDAGSHYRQRMIEVLLRRNLAALPEKLA
jgi:hypothetical protein